jgi:hypothetical protein
MLMSLLQKQPALKSSVLQLIPRPSVAAAIRALDAAAKRLSDSYPYSNTATSSFSGAPWPQLVTNFGSNSQQGSKMRDGYIQSRIRPPCAEFLSTSFSYLPYFSCVPDSSNSHSLPQTSHSSMVQVLHQDKFQPSETVMFLTTFTRYIISQPALSQDIILEEAAGRLSREWMAWVDFIDSYVNRQGGMFASSEMSKWLRALDELVQARRHERLSFLKDVQTKLVGVLGVFVDPHSMQI